MPVQAILNTLELLLPAFIPSWRFFDTIAPSPRIEFALLKTAQDTADSWQEFRPRPVHMPIRDMLKHLFWNPRWNETLFLVSCAERLMENPTEHSAHEVVTRIRSELERSAAHVMGTPYLQFRLVFVHRENVVLQKNITFISQPYHCFESAA